MLNSIFFYLHMFTLYTLHVKCKFGGAVWAVARRIRYYTTLLEFCQAFFAKFFKKSFPKTIDKKKSSLFVKIFKKNF